MASRAATIERRVSVGALLTISFLLLLGSTAGAAAAEKNLPKDGQTNTESQLMVRAVDESGLPIPLKVCIWQGSSFNRCERTTEESPAHFEGLAAGAYTVAIEENIETWQQAHREIALTAGERREIEMEVVPWFDIETLNRDSHLGWRLRLERQSGWGPGGSLDVAAHSQKTVVHWRSPRSEKEPEPLELNEDERAQLIDALERARLFSGDHVGTNTMSTDGPFNTLRVEKRGATAILVTSGNPSFARGARRELLLLLNEYQERLRR